MRRSNSGNSGFFSSWLFGIARQTFLFTLSAICVSSAVQADDPAALQLDFAIRAESPELPMEIVNGAEPATTDNIQPAARDSESAVHIPEESKGTTLEVFTGTVKSEPIVNDQPQVFPIEKAAVLSTREVAQLDLLTARLITQSRDAWQRGLMDHASYEAWLDLASTTQLRIAKQQGDEKRVLRILRNQLALWTEAAAQLKEFNQPASYGWEADLTHSRIMVLRAKLLYHAATGHSLPSTDQQAYQLLTTQHLDARLAEFRTGIGTAASVLAAARMVDEQLVVPEVAGENSGKESNIAIATFQVDQPVAIRLALKEVLRPVHLATYPRAISARDLEEDRAAIQLAETFADYIDTPQEGRNQGQFLDRINQHAAEVAVRQFARFETGTATPGDMVREWWLQESIAGPLAEELQENTDFFASQTRRLERIHQIGVSLSDLRGRNSADVAAADLLLAARQLELEPLSGRQKSTPREEVQETSEEALVIEYGESDDTTKSEISSPQ